MAFRLKDTVLVMEGGVGGDIDPDVAHELERMDIIYFCPICNAYHISPDHSWGDVNDVVGNRWK